MRSVKAACIGETRTWRQSSTRIIFAVRWPLHSDGAEAEATCWKTFTGALTAKIAEARGYLEARIAETRGLLEAKIGELEAKINAMETRLIRWCVGTAISMAGLGFGLARHVPPASSDP